MSYAYVSGLPAAKATYVTHWQSDTDDRLHVRSTFDTGAGPDWAKFEATWFGTPDEHYARLDAERAAVDAAVADRGRSDIPTLSGKAVTT